MNMSVANPPTHAPDVAARPAGPGLLGPTVALGWRELVRFGRQRGRVVGAVATPLLLWVMIGVGLNNAVTLAPDATQGVAAAEPGADGGVDYLAYFYPGMILMVVLFTSIFSTITVIEDRKEGFLQAVLVSPASRLAIVGGKVLGGSVVAVVQGVVLLAVWPAVGGWPGLGAMLGAVAVLFVIAAGLTALGLALAWRMSSAGAFHGVMSLILMPMWLLSGAMFPLASAGALKYVMLANPMTYGQSAFASLLLGGHAAAGLSPAVSLPIMCLWAGLAVVAAVVVAQRPSRTGR